MASLVTHALWGLALAQGAPQSARRDPRFWCSVVPCSWLPDGDVVGMRLGIHYADMLGHRGLSHSLFFAALAGVLVGMLLGRSRGERRSLAFLFFLVTASHGVLDAMTDGGLGVAFFAPFRADRYFLPWRPIHVAPLGVSAAVSGRWLRVLESEMRSVWVPALTLGILLFFYSTRQAIGERIAPGDSSR